MKHLGLPLSVALLALVFLLRSALPAFAEEEKGPDWGYTELDEVDPGTQLTGPPLSFYDLQGRVVVCYQWCITCPLSTGAFPYMNRLYKRYKDRGVAVVGFQVRRDPDVLENNVVWHLEHLKPNFPVSMLGNDWEWPARYLPWVIVFDHEGKRIYGGNLKGIEKVLDKALDRAPDYVVGGPYEKLGAMAAEIASNRLGMGEHLPALRELAAGEGDNATEARKLLACVTRYFDRQILKAVEDMNGPAEEAIIYRQLASIFDGDLLGDKARAHLSKLTSKPGHAVEEAAYRDLERARLAFRRLPPGGRYAYNMDYSEVKDETVLATRSRKIAELRAELTRIQAGYPDTQAASDAKFLMFEYEIPDLDREQIRTQVEQAEKLLAGSPRPYEVFDAYLLLYEVIESYYKADEHIEKAKGMFSRLREQQAEKLDTARDVHLALSSDEARIKEQVRLGGAALPREEADRHIQMLEIAAKEAGPASRLARRTAEFIEQLRKSYEGPGRLYIAFDNRYTGKGVRIRGVYPRTSAEKAGLARNDVILEFNGKKIGSADDLKKAVTAGKPGQDVRLLVRRAGESQTTETIEIRLDRRVR